MPATDLDNMLLAIAAEKKMANLSATTIPTETEGVGWINDGIKDLTRCLCPIRVDNGKWTAGRLDKLTKITETETYTKTLYAEQGFNIADLPINIAGICFYVAVRIGIATAPVRARETTLLEVKERQLGTFAAGTDNPIFAWYSSAVAGTPPARIIFAPTIFCASPGPIDYNVEYHYIKLPTDMAQSTAEAFPLDDDLRDVIMEYVRIQIWTQAKDAGRTAKYMKRYFDMIEELISASPIIEEV